MTEETETENRKLTLIEWWCLPVHLALEYLGLAGIIFAIPYFIASIVIASVIVIGALLIALNSLFYLFFY